MPGPFGVFLTYDSQRICDGSGAQIQRIMSIFSAARFARIGYVHTDLVSIEPNPGDGLQTKLERSRFVSTVNAFCRLPNERPSRVLAHVRIRTLQPWSLRLLRWLHHMLRVLRLSLVVHATSAYGWIDRSPWNYEYASSHLRPKLNETLRRVSKELVVDCHIRRALAPSTTPNGQPYGRHLPTRWVRDILTPIREVTLESQIDLRIRVHTDFPASNRTWLLPENGVYPSLSMWQAHNLVDKDMELTAKAEDFSNTLEGFGTLEVIQDLDALQTIELMVSSDILLISPSSLSYVAGLLRAARPVVAPPFWHGCLPTWVITPPTDVPIEAGTEVWEQIRQLALDAVRSCTVRGA